MFLVLGFILQTLSLKLVLHKSYTG